MKAPNFRYVRPSSLGQALRILADGDAVALAGGQSLLAGLNMRLSSPSILVDIGALEELRGIGEGGDVIRIGALTRHHQLIESPPIRAHVPLLAHAANHIAHVAIRNRGTIGGSLAYADPAAELPACCVAIDAVIELADVAGRREVRAEEFFTGLFETERRRGELIVAVKVPSRRPGSRAFGFAELARRRGDFALAGVAATAECDAGRIATARVVYFGCVDRARLAVAVSAAASVTPPDDEAISAALRRDVAPDDSAGLRADTKRHLAGVLTRRVIAQLRNGGLAHG